ncbi:MAG: hypothetical protein AAF716_04145 [Cyanobacteria bacterium P01_D01_bin.1]
MIPARSQRSRSTFWIANAILIAGLCFATLFTFHALSVLMFAALGQMPGSPHWSKVVFLVGVLVIASIAVCWQSFAVRQPLYRCLGTVSSTASGAVLGTFVAGRASGEQIAWAVVGVVGGCLALGVIAFWAYDARRSKSRQLVGRAIAVINGLCAYTVAFGVGAWFLAALAASAWILASILGIVTLLFLFATRRALTVFNRCL